MSRFDAAFATGGLPGLMHKFGQSVICALANGLDKSVTAMKSPETTRTDEIHGITQTVRVCDVTIDTDDVSDPYRITKITIGGEEWSRGEVKERTGAYSVVEALIFERTIGA